MQVITISNWAVGAMPSATYTSIAAAIGADAIAFAGTTGYAPGSLGEFEQIALNAPSVVNGPKTYIQATSLGLVNIGGGAGRAKRRNIR